MLDFIIGALIVSAMIYWVVGIWLDSGLVLSAGAALFAVASLGVSIDIGNEAIHQGERVRQACAMIPDAIFTDDLSCVLPNGTVVK